MFISFLFFFHSQGVDVEDGSPPGRKDAEQDGFDDVTGQVGKNVTAYVSAKKTAKISHAASCDLIV